MKRVIEKINGALEGHKNIGYIGIYYENQLEAYFAVEKELKENGIEMSEGMIFFEKRYMPTVGNTIQKLLEAKRIVRRGDYYGDGFTGYLIEELRFYKD